MKSEKVLEMINNGKIEELKAMLQDEIYSGTLNSKTGTKQRYSAMKRYQNSVSMNNNNELFKRVGTNIDIDGEKYNCFIDGWCIAMTTEEVGGLEKHDSTKHGEYFKINQMIPSLYVSNGKVNYNEILADAKTKGYKYTKDLNKNKITVKISNEHINVALLEKAYSVIDDGELPELFIPKDDGRSPIVLKNSIGICLLLPININSEKNTDLIVFDADIKNKKVA